jgi:hypothetical protein
MRSKFSVVNRKFNNDRLIYRKFMFSQPKDMKQEVALNLDKDLIRPLKKAQNEFMQVLVTSFRISRGEVGLVLEVSFDEDTLAVWLREGKDHLRRQMDPALADRYQKELDRFVHDPGEKELVFHDPRFPFRFGNGGTLPVLHYGDKDYYCFFYRDIWPIGWNISNGGAESLSELLDPLAIIEREFREELIIVEPTDKCRYIFDWSEGKRPDHPDFSIARRVWDEIFDRHDFQKIEDRTLPLKWLSGHDTVVIRYNDVDTVTITDCFVNINARDFGIEIDRVAKLSVNSNAILCDGELSKGKLVNQVVGLFEVGRFSKNLESGHTEFMPDLIFWNGQSRPSADIKSVVGEYLDYVVTQGIKNIETRREWEAYPEKYDLCPASRNILDRYLHLEKEVVIETAPVCRPPARKKSSRPEVFLSFASEDLLLARKVFAYLCNEGHNVFFSDETMHRANFGTEIDNALKNARSLVLVGSEPSHFYKPWVQYEWQSFHNDILSRRKPLKTPMVTFTQKPRLNSLPRPLTYRHIIDYSRKPWEESLRELNNLLLK